SGIKKATAKGQGKVRSAYLYQKAYEMLTDRITESYSNDAMVLGSESESLSRDVYYFSNDVEIERVAIIKEGPHRHVSPDGLVGEDGIIEIKNINGPGYIETVSKQRVGAEHAKQIQWGLYISQREWCDFIQAHWIWGENGIIAGYTDKPIWVKRVYRDEKLIKEMDEGADKFITEMLALVEKIKGD
ncbi:unnamed protein product, partial [marine sediment metagenome]